MAEPGRRGAVVIALVYLRSRSNDERGTYMATIWTMSADGSRPVRVLRRVSYDQLPLESPAWQPR